MTDNALKALADQGVSVWLDDLSRERIETDDLKDLIDRGVVGVTTNPSIFQAALAKGDRYDADLRQFAVDGKTVDETVFALTTEDVRNACDLFLPLYESTDGIDGRVSIEVEPRLAKDTGKTVAEAKKLAGAVDRPNVLIKIPATVEGLPAFGCPLSSVRSSATSALGGSRRWCCTTPTRRASSPSRRCWPRASASTSR